MRAWRARLANPLWAILLLYAGGYGWFLAATGFLPYVFDNNESFSAFVHGSNLFHFGLDKSYGLTDEAYGPDTAAHPYVYTHQGNFPRLFAWALYALGLRSVEAQIAASTFSVGLATVALIYVFFDRLAGRAYALIATVLFMSDYLLFAQWQVNTFKVWHGFLLFATLVSVQSYVEGGNRKWLAALAATSALIAYFDLLMAVFTFALTTVYTAGLCLRRNRSAIGPIFSAQAAGALASIALFVVQLLGYYGWEGLRQDVYLTFFGRNYAADDPSAIAEWQQFFVDRRIVFWEALVDSNPFANAGSLFRSVFQYGLGVYTPYLSFLILAIGLARLVAAPVRLAGNAAAALPHRLLRVVGDGALYLFWLALNLVFAVILLSGAVENQPAAGTALLRSFGSAALPALITLAAALAVPFTWLSRAFLAGVSAADTSARQAARLVAAGGFCLALAALAAAQSGLYKTYPLSNDAIWQYVLAPWSESGSSKLFAVTTVALCVAYLLFRRLDETATDFSGVGLYLLAGISGYAVAYFFSPGYMVLINLKRYTPVLVFFLAPVAAVAFHWLWQLLAARAARQGHSPGENPIAARLDRFMPAAALLLLVHLAVYWIGLQKAYVELIPPDGAAVFAKLARDPYRGAGFVVSGYGAPVAANAGSWAYIDNLFIAGGNYRLDDAGYRPDGTDVYKWFADRDDPKYRNPEFALCFDSPGFHDALRVIEIRNRFSALRFTPGDIYEPGEGIRAQVSAVDRTAIACDGSRLVAKAAEGASGELRLALMERDASLLHRWSIVRLEHDFPPYLAPLRGGQGEVIEVKIESAGCRARVRYEYRQQQGRAEHGSRMRAWLVSGPGVASKKRLIYSGAAGGTINLPRRSAGLLQIALTPRSATREGRTYMSDPVAAGGC